MEVWLNLTLRWLKGNSVVPPNRDTLINQQSDKSTDKSKDEIEAGLCSSTYEAVPASGSKFRSRQFRSCLCERVRVFFPLSLWAVPTELQDDPLGPSCSPPAPVGPLHPQRRQSGGWGPSYYCGPTIRSGSWWCTGGGRDRGLGTELHQKQLWVGRWLLWLHAGVHGRAGWSVPVPLSIR